MQMNALDSDTDVLLSVYDVSDKLSVSTQAVRNWIRTGKLPAVRLPNGKYRVLKSDVIKLLEPVRNDKSDSEVSEDEMLF